MRKKQEGPSSGRKIDVFAVQWLEAGMNAATLDSLFDLECRNTEDQALFKRRSEKSQV